MYAELNRLRKSQMDSVEETRERQLGKLAAVLDYAASNSRFYEGRLGPAGTSPLDRLRGADVLTKVDLQENLSRLRADPAPSRVHRKTTGGSTGQPVTVLKDAAAIAAERAATWMAHEWFGIEIGDRGARFWGSPRSPGRRWLRFALADIAMNRIRLSAFGVTDEIMDSYWDRCESFRPQYLYGYVSMLERFARHLQNRGLDGARLGVKCVVTTSESLSATQRELLETVFDAPVQNEYGCGEVGPIAYQCKTGNLHVMSDNVVVELLDDAGNEVAEGQEGSVVVTDLNNRALPLIRYRLEDRAVKGRACDCGRGLPVLAEIRGRKYDFVESPRGEAFHGEFFMYLFEDLRVAGLPVGCFRIVQDTSDHLDVEVQAPSSAAAAISSAVSADLGNQLGMRIDVRVSEELTLSGSGKLRVIENRVKQGAGS